MPLLYYNLALAINSKKMDENTKLDSLDKILYVSINSYKKVLEVEPENDRAIYIWSMLIKL